MVSADMYLLSAGVVDICLIPEVHFSEDKLMSYIDRQLNKKGHVVICVAEGAGQDMLAKSGTHQGFDASGNPILQDVGTYLRQAIRAKLEVMSLPYGACDDYACRPCGSSACHEAGSMNASASQPDAAWLRAGAINFRLRTIDRA